MVNLRPNPVDLAAAVIGFALLEAGIARLSVPAALITAGVLLLVGSLTRRTTE